MSHEVEAKVRVDAFKPVRVRLLDLGAKRRGAVVQQNLLFDQPCGGLRSRGCGLRLRLEQPVRGGDRPPVLTFKGPKRQDTVLKARPELELNIADAATMQRVLEAMGYRCTLDYQKRRETWKLGEATVELDDVPLLGRFVEVEAGNERTVHDALEQLGLEDLPLLRRGYAAMLRRKLKKGRHGPAVLKLAA
jgi:adenylate cyclase class 2